MYNVENFEKVKKNCERFWNHEFIGRPYISITAPKDNAEPVWNEFSYVKQIEKAWNGDFLSTAENYMKIAKNVFYGGEALPYFTMDFAKDYPPRVGRSREINTIIIKTHGINGDTCSFS